MIALGIDISQHTFDASIEVDTKHKHKQFANTVAGFQQLSKWLVRLMPNEGQVHACMEATGAYWEALAEFLHAAGHKVSVVNPARIKGHAQSQMLRHKTDQLDSAVNRHFCATQNPPEWHPPAPEIKALRALVRRRDDLVQMQTQETNRLKSGSASPPIAESIRALLESIKLQLKLIAKQVQDLLKLHPKLAHQVALLRSIKGFGLISATKFLAETLGITQYAHARALAASIGITPAFRRSGTSLNPKPHISKMGNAHLRAALWWPTISAIRYNPVIKAFAAKLRKQKKNNCLVIIACMHKLVRLAYGVIHSDTPFDPLWNAIPA